MHRNLTGLGAECKSSHTDEIAYVHQFLEHLIIHVLVVARTNVVAGDINLYAAFGVLKFGKTGFAHYPTAHQPAGYAYLTRLVPVIELILYVNGKSVCGIFCCGIRIDAHLAQFLKALASANFLFT